MTCHMHLFPVLEMLTQCIPTGTRDEGRRMQLDSLSRRTVGKQSSIHRTEQPTPQNAYRKYAGEVVTFISWRAGAGSELRSLHATSNRMMLSQEEMVCRLAGLFIFLHFVVFGSITFMKIIYQEEVVLKRCWLARYRKLSVRLGTEIIFL